MPNLSSKVWNISKAGSSIGAWASLDVDLVGIWEMRGGGSEGSSSWYVGGRCCHLGGDAPPLKRAGSWACRLGWPDGLNTTGSSSCISRSILKIFGKNNSPLLHDPESEYAHHGWRVPMVYHVFQVSKLFPLFLLYWGASATDGELLQLCTSYRHTDGYCRPLDSSLFDDIQCIVAW